MYLSLGQAAKETGKSKSVIAKAIKSGRLTARKNDKGEWEIDPAELFRVYPQENPEDTKKERESTPENTLKYSLLEQEVEFLRQHLEREKEISRGLEKDRDHWRQQATALLTDQRPPQTRPGFWGRLFKTR